MVFWKGILKELEPHGILENSGFTLKREPSWIFWKKNIFWVPWVFERKRFIFGEYHDLF